MIQDAQPSLKSLNHITNIRSFQTYARDDITPKNDLLDVSLNKLASGKFNAQWRQVLRLITYGIRY